MYFLAHLLPDLTAGTSSRIDQLHFEAGVHRRQPKLALVFCFSLNVVVHFVTDAFLLLLCLIWFLPCNAMLAQYMLSSCVSVRLSF